MGHFIDLTGQVFGLYKILNRNYVRINNTYWNCQCECGNITVVEGANLKNRSTVSCGCLRRSKCSDLGKKAVIHGLCKTREYEIFKRAKIRASKENLPFNIEVSDIVIPEYCPVLGIEILLKSSIEGKVCDNSPSLDKLIPALGYTKGNIKVISHRANTLKRDGKLDEFLKLAEWMSKELEIQRQTLDSNYTQLEIDFNKDHTLQD